MMLHNDCNTYVVWSLMSNNSLMDYNCPKTYPSISELTATKMRPKYVTFKVLEDTVDVIKDKMRKGIWLESNVKVYCMSNRLNVVDTYKLIDSVKNVLSLEYYRSDGGQ